MTAALVAGLLAGYGIAMPVGAVGAYLVSLTARTSFTIGACAALGVATADGLYALIAMAGGSALTPVIEPVMVPLRWISAAVLIALAARGGASAIRQYRERRRSAAPADETPMGPARAYGALLAITMLNPMTVIYFAALVVGSQTGQEATVPEQAVFVLAAFAASASWQLLVAGGGALLGRALTGVRGRLATAIASSSLIAVLAVHLLVSAP